MKQHNYTKYFRVNSEDTTVTEISANNFKLPCTCDQTAGVTYTLLPGNEGIYLYTDISQAMEKAKACAQACIERLIAGGAETLPALLQYRMDHYEDLNVNLVDANIQKTENEMKTESNFQWKPYKIHS